MEISWDTVRGVIQNMEDTQIAICNLSRETALLDIEYLADCMPDKPSHFFGTVKINGKVDVEQTITQSLSYWHTLVEYLRRVESLPGFAQLKQQLHTHPGYINQLLATIYLIDSGINVIGIENGGVKDADIIALINGMTVHFHVKTIGQHEKWNAQFAVDEQIFYKLWHLPILNELGQRIGLKSISGICRRLLTDEELEKIIAQIPQQMEVTIKTDYQPPGKQSNVDELTLIFDWHVERGTSGGINVFRNFDDHLKQVESKVDASDVKHVLLGVCRGADEVRVDESRLEARKISAMFFIDTQFNPINGVHFSRSKIFGKQSEKQLINHLETALPKISDTNVP